MDVTHAAERCCSAHRDPTWAGWPVPAAKHHWIRFLCSALVHRCGLAVVYSERLMRQETQRICARRTPLPLTAFCAANIRTVDTAEPSLQVVYAACRTRTASYVLRLWVAQNQTGLRFGMKHHTRLARNSKCSSTHRQFRNVTRLPAAESAPNRRGRYSQPGTTELRCHQGADHCRVTKPSILLTCRSTACVLREDCGPD